MRIERNAPAKINLTLEVLGRRADGYHEIASVMHTLSLCDTLVMELPNAPELDAGQGYIEVVPRFLASLGMTKTFSTNQLCHSERSEESQSIPTDSRNLIWKAVEAFEAAVLGTVGRDFSDLTPLAPLSVNGEGGSAASRTLTPLSTRKEGEINVAHAPDSPSPFTERGLGGEVSTQGQDVNCYWKATLTKRIPTQAGLGGGSSDAAAALLCLAEWARRWDIRPPDLRTLAAQLGADVAFFLNGGCALARGKGEILSPLPTLPQFWWVIAKPNGVGVPTAWAYEQLRRSELKPNMPAPYTQRLVNALQHSAIRTPRDLAPLLHNDFDAPILNAIPELRTLRQQMEQAGVLRVILCGSGAAQAGLCTTQKHAETIANSLIQQGYWAVAACTS